MGNAFYRIKIGLYVFVIALVGMLFAVRAYNALQKTVYLTPAIFDNGDVRISLSYPAKILSPKNETSYPLTISFIRLRDLSQSHAYEIVFESSTLLFVDAKGAEITPRFQITSEHVFIEQNVYVRPFQSERYPASHAISIKILVDGQEYLSQPDPIEIKTEPKWLSYLSLAAASLLEISIASALVTWIANTLDTTWNARKELISQMQNDLSNLASLPLLEQIRKFRELENKIRDAHLEEDLKDDLQRIRKSLSSESDSESRFLQAIGNALRKGGPNELTQVKELYEYVFTGQKGFEKHQVSISALAKILDSSSIVQDAIPLISAIVKLWDDFDADVKDLIVGVLEKLSQKTPLSEIPATDLYAHAFINLNRRRLFRDTELQKIFPQLVDSATGKPRPLGYKATWLDVSKPKDNPKVLDWLKQHALIANPFGWDDLKNSPFYPEGFVRPGQWEAFLDPVPLFAHCPTTEDAKPLAFLLRVECLPVRKDEQKDQIEKSKRQIFPIWISLEQTSLAQLPFPALAHSAARAWLDILPLCPDALLDLPLSEQQALLELLCWSLSSNDAVIHLLKRSGLEDNTVGQVLTRKISEFENRFSPAHLPQDAVLLSWLKIRPPELNQTYLILSIDDFRFGIHPWWFEPFSSLISTLFLNGIVTKAVSSTPAPISLSLPEMYMSWSDKQLSLSLEQQFSVAANLEEARIMGAYCRFPELFGPGATEEETTKKLISASHHSLARMLTLGNRLLQKHCEKEVPEKYLTLEELNDILKTA